MWYTAQRVMGASTVVLDGQEYTLLPRTRMIVEWLLQRAAEIDTAHHLELIFHCAGRRVTPAAHEVWPVEVLRTPGRG